MIKFDKLDYPKNGNKIEIKDGQLIVPNHVNIPFIEGDGTGKDITTAMRRVVDAAIEKTYKGKRKIEWFEIFAGEKALALYDTRLPEETIKAIEHFIVGIKGPLTTPVGEGYRSLNVAMRQKLDLYNCIRPCKYYGAPSPVKNPEDMNIVIFRENTEDVYAGIEWEKGTEKVKKIRQFIEKEYGIKLPEDSGIGIKPISEKCSKRLVRAAIKYAIKNNLPSVTLMHKGNIQKFTEGAFRKWGYEVAIEEFRDFIITEQELLEKYDGKMPEGKILIKDRIADSIFQQVLTRTKEYSIIATTNLNGDYISDACAAQIGGLGIAPGANIGDNIALFEPCHGSAPKYANQDKVNPSAIVLSAVMMLKYIGWDEAGTIIERAIRKAIKEKKVTYDFARLFNINKELKTSEYANELIKNINNEN
ncbi:MAG: isocitrate dehydrogenase (NADP(+)) [Promethearchaeota archaeon]